MKKTLFPIILLVIFSACSLNSKTAENSKFEKGVIKIRTEYPNSTSGFDLTYDSQNQVIKITDSIDNSYINCEYNKDGLPIKFKVFFNGVLSNYKVINWFTDSLHVDKFIIVDDEAIENCRETYFYNENKHLEKIIRYKKDSLGNWQKRGSKYEFKWENGNMTQIKCFVVADFANNDSLLLASETEDDNLFNLDEISDEIIKNGYTLFYVSTYTYDNKNNPYYNTSISQLILPNESNISANNPIAIEKKYTGGEVINFKLKYEYNESNYPTMTFISVTSNIEIIKKVEYTRSFGY